MQLSAREQGFEKISRVHCAVALACADDSVKLVYKKNDFALAFFDFVEDGFQAFFKLASEFGSRNKRTHIQRENCFVFQPFGNVSAYYSQRETFGNRRFAHARLSYEYGVVFCFAGKDSYDVADFSVAADNGVELVGARTLNEVEAVFVERVVGGFGIVAGYSVCFHLF